MALSLDGTPQTLSQGATTVVFSTFTTTAGSGQVVVCILSNAASVTSVTATGLTFTARTSYTGGFGYNCGAVYTAPYTVNFSGVVTVTLASSTAGQCTLFAIGGADTTGTPGDSGGPVNNSGTTAPSVTTTNANDFVYTSTNSTVATPTPGTGWTLIAGAGSMLVEYQIVSATGTYTTSQGSGTLQGSIIDAIKQGAGGGDTFANYSRISFM